MEVALQQSATVPDKTIDILEHETEHNIEKICWRW